MTKSTFIPKPEPITTNALLPSQGYKDGRATLHIYHETRECEVEGPAFEFIYKCVETNAERRWGIVERVEFETEGN